MKKLFSIKIFIFLFNIFLNFAILNSMDLKKLNMATPPNEGSRKVKYF